MRIERERSRPFGGRVRGAIATAAVWTAVAIGFGPGTGTARAGDAPPFTARAGEDLARAAALTWADDARLVYVESDAPLTPEGAAARWGYLFRSEARATGRAYSVERGEIRIATDPPFDFDAPPLPDGWIDSAAALAAAEKEAGSEFRRDHAGRVQALFLVRGVMDESRPGVATWAVVYSSESAPGLWVVVDAHDGKVKKQWRG